MRIRGNVEAGRELDVLVSDKVFGHPQASAPTGMGESISRSIYVSGPDGKYHCPPYSTDIAAAWEVVERMALKMERQSNLFSGGDGFEWRGPNFKKSSDYLTNEGYPTGTTCWYVVLTNKDWRKIICADTAPHVICLAALKAID